MPIRIGDIGEVTIGHAPAAGPIRLPEEHDDAVEGVILMRRGEQTQNVLNGVQQKPKS